LENLNFVKVGLIGAGREAKAIIGDRKKLLHSRFSGDLEEQKKYLKDKHL